VVCRVLSVIPDEEVGVDVGVQVGVAVGAGVEVAGGGDVGVCVGVEVGVRVGVEVGVRVGVGVEVAPGGGVGVWVGVKVRVGVGVVVDPGGGVGVWVAVKLGVGVGVAPGGGVDVEETAGVAVGVAGTLVGVREAAGVDVLEGVGVGVDTIGSVGDVFSQPITSSRATAARLATGTRARFEIPFREWRDVSPSCFMGPNDRTFRTGFRCRRSRKDPWEIPKRRTRSMGLSPGEMPPLILLDETAGYFPFWYVPTSCASARKEIRRCPVGLLTSSLPSAGRRPAGCRPPSRPR